MYKSKIRQRRRVVATFLVAAFLGHQMILPVLASDISNVTGENGVYTIDPTAINSDVGFRKYNRFELSQGDIANFIMNYDGTDISKFVNLVNNKIDINGIVNTLRADGTFANNGGLVFISPEGMVVGSSGVLNVGSLSVLTPTQEDYENFKGNILTTPTLYNDLRTLRNSQGTGTVTEKTHRGSNSAVLFYCAPTDISPSLQRHRDFPCCHKMGRKGGVLL